MSLAIAKILWVPSWKQSSRGQIQIQSTWLNGQVPFSKRVAPTNPPRFIDPDPLRLRQLRKSMTLDFGRPTLATN